MTIFRSLAAICMLVLISCSSTNPCILTPPPFGLTRQARTEDAVRRCEKHWPGALQGKPIDRLGYDFACRQVFCQLSSIGAPPVWRQTLLKENSRLSVASPMENRPEWNLANVDRIRATAEYGGASEIKALTEKSIGMPLVLEVDYKRSAAVPAKLFPLNGRRLPATMIVDCSQPGKPVVRITNTIEKRTIGGVKSTPLAVDYVTPLNASFRSGFFGELFSLPRLLIPEKGLEEVGIYSVVPYQKGRIPVIFVHGIQSDPAVWNHAMEAIWSDPQLSQRYQVWYFLYPTGLPIPESAARLRKALQMTRNYYDPAHQDAALSKMVLVGHSMGGVLSQWQVVDSGTKLWDAFFKSKPEKLPLSRQQVATLKEQLIFSASPDVSRAIFVAAPHHGSNMAKKGIGSLVAPLIKLPFTLTQITLQLATLDPALLNTDLRLFKHHGQASMDTLRSDYPGLRVISSLPIRVPHHSIIGRFGFADDLLECTDGVVPYRSSHLASAKSEIVIPAFHSCCRHPQTVQEIVRILRSN